MASPRIGADIKLYFTTTDAGDFVGGKRGVSPEFTRDMVDTTAQATPSSALAKTFEPGLFGVSFEVTGIAITTTTGVQNLTKPRAFSSFLLTALAGTKCAAKIKIFDGTVGEDYTDEVYISIDGFVKAIKLDATNLGEAATYTVTFQGTGVATTTPGFVPS